MMIELPNDFREPAPTDKGPGVYVICHPATGSFYVGSSANVRKRLTDHKSLLTTGQHVNLKLQAAYEEDKNIDVLVKTTDDRISALQHEQELLDQHVGRPECLNQAVFAASPGKARIISEETRQRMSAAQLGRQHSPETIEKLKKAKEGYVPSQKARDVSRQMRLGVSLPDEVKEKMRQSQQARGKPIVYEGQPYTSLKAAARTTGVNVSTLRRRVKDQLC